MTVVSKHIEFGQGSHAGLAAIVAEELDADWDKVKVVQAPGQRQGLRQHPDGRAGHRRLVRDRQLLGRSCARPARRRGPCSSRPPPTQLERAGRRDHGARTAWSPTPRGKSATFAELLADAAKVDAAADPDAEGPDDFTLIGTDRVRRKDTPAKSTGTAALHPGRPPAAAC